MFNLFGSELMTTPGISNCLNCDLNWIPGPGSWLRAWPYMITGWLQIKSSM